MPQGFTIEGEAIGGFYTTRFIRAEEDMDAGRVAISSSRSEEKFRKLRALLPSDPVVEAKEIEVVDASRVPKDALFGFAFFTNESDDAA